MKNQKQKNKGSSDPFVHVLLFECANCGCPVASAVTSAARNMEAVDVRELKLRCDNCDWSGNSAGVVAHSHWVEEWVPKTGQPRRRRSVEPT